MDAFSDRFEIMVFSMNLEYFCKHMISTTESKLSVKVRPVSHQKQEILRKLNLWNKIINTKSFFILT